MTEAGLLAAASTLFISTLAGAGVWWLRVRTKTAEPTTGAAPDEAASTEPFTAPEATLPVMSYTELVQFTSIDGLITRSRSMSGLNQATWENHVHPVLERVVELVQLIPASESHHHSEPGGLITHLAETMEAAIHLRRGVILPPARPADEVSLLKHRWTVGLIIAALLHDIGKPVSDVRIRLYSHALHGHAWNAIAGTMADAGALAYAVDFPPAHERDYQAHQKLGAMLMQRLVPAKTLAWLAEDKHLIGELVAYLSLDPAAEKSALAKLVKDGETQSVRSNLLKGPRTRFATARAVPLIERLMGAMRRMLAEGAALPLNRPGAAGYVFQGDVWFAAARLANSVREYLIANESSVAVPGDDKNDRLFDVWQDYGACRINPDSGRALWSGRIEFDQHIGNPGYDLPAMLRFPVALLFDAGNLPIEMPGQIIPLRQVAADPTAESSAGDQSPAAEPVARNQKTEAVPNVSASHQTKNVEQQEDEGDESRRRQTEAVESSRASTPSSDASDAPEKPLTGTSAQEAAPVQESIQNFLDSDDSAAAVELSAARKPSPSTPPALQVEPLKPVSPALNLPKGKPSKGDPSAGAVAFMTWVQRGVADGSLPYNTTGALVHFVRYGDKTGLLLVSPSIFRQYASAEPEESRKETDAPGHATQRQLSNSGWHLKGPKGKNIWPYQVMRAGGKGGNLLNGFLILEPERFFAPVPPPNDRLILWSTPEISGNTSEGKK